MNGWLVENRQATSIPAAQSAVDNSDSGKTAIQMSTATAQEAAEVADGEGGKNGEGMNWLVALAKALGEMQGAFMDKALAAKNEMIEAGGETDTSAQPFITAQNKFSANMQMFGILANTSSTALKTLAEGLTALARKQ